MRGRLRVLHAGPGTTLQDSGRHGYLRYGVTPAGPMDWTAFRTANFALGNDERAAAIEIPPGGVEVICEDVPLWVAFAGGAFVWRRGGVTLPIAARLHLQPGETSRGAGGRGWRVCLSRRRWRIRYAGRDGQPGDASALRDGWHRRADAEGRGCFARRRSGAGARWRGADRRAVACARLRSFPRRAWPARRLFYGGEF